MKLRFGIAVLLLVGTTAAAVGTTVTANIQYYYDVDRLLFACKRMTKVQDDGFTLDQEGLLLVSDANRCAAS